MQRLLALTLGLCYPFSLAPYDLPVIGLFSVAGFVALLRQASMRQTLWLCFFYGLGLYGAGASWVYVSIHTYGHAPPPLAGIMTGAFVAFLALCFALPFIVLCLTQKTAGKLLLTFPAAWVLSEWFRGWFLTGFPWLYLGYGHSDTWLAGWGPIGGVLAISWISAFSGAVIAFVALRWGALKVRLAGWLALCVLWSSGWALEQIAWTKAEDKPLEAALVQPNLPLEQKWDSHALREILDTYTQLTEPLWGRDLILWPESAIPRLLEDVQSYLAVVDRLAKDNHSALITGIPSRTGQDTFNSAVALGDGSGIYHKRHLVPFGEYVPLERWLRGLIHFFDLPMSSFSSGDHQQQLLYAKGHPIATSICYEIVFPDLVAASAQGAHLLLTLSNDTWFGRSIGPHQHLQMARMRAIENRKPVVRATNDGLTAIIGSNGQIMGTLPQFQRDVLVGPVTPHTGTTPFNHLGSWPVIGFSILVLIWARRHTKTPEPKNATGAH